MTRLTKADEKRATEALAKCAAATKNIDDPKELNEKAFDILYKELGDKPELLKRACEGYNSAKSVYRLGAATDDTRGNNFGILDAPALAKRASEKSKASFINKAASAYGVRKAQFSVDVAPQQQPVNFRKSASATTVRSSDPVPGTKLEGASLIAETMDFIDDTNDSLRKIASARRDVLTDRDRKEESFIAGMRELSPDMRKEASEILYALHGEPADLLIKMYNAAEPMNKVASYSKSKYKGSISAPEHPIYKSAAAVLTSHAMVKLATAVQDVFVQSAVTGIKDLMGYKNGLSKSAALLPTPTYGADLAGKILIGQEVVDNLPGLLSEKSKDDLMKDVLNTQLNNALRRHGIKRAFMNTVTDETVARYPLHQVTTAFNDSLAELPIKARNLPPSAFSALVKSRTIARLGRGGAASGSDVDQILNMEKSYSDSFNDSDKKRRKYE